MALASNAVAGDMLLPTKAPPPPPTPTAYDWTGFYLGGQLGYGWGNSGWTTPGAAGSLNLAQRVDTFNESGSFFAGVQGGYNYMLRNRWLVGVEFDVGEATEEVNTLGGYLFTLFWGEIHERTPFMVGCERFRSNLVRHR